MLVADVVEGSPAQAAGLGRGDVIEAVNDIDIEDKEHFLGVMRNYVAGEEVRLRLFKAGGQAGQRRTVAVRTTALTRETAAALAWDRWGFAVAESPAGRGGGLIVGRIRPGSPVEALRLAPGDRLAQIGGTALNGPGDLVQAAARHYMQSSLILRVERAGRLYYLRLNM